MFYINTRKSTAPVKQKDLLDAMLIPPEERLTKDHQIVYRFFISNEMLKQIERARSLNARIKCIAAMNLIGQQNFLPQEQILMHPFEDGRAIVLPKQSKQNAQMFNEKLLRRKMDLLAGFAIMQSLHYDELLYLAYHMEEMTCKYKEYLYREGQPPQSFFLIVDGEFYYVKDCAQREPKKKLHKKENGRVKKVRKDEQEEENPNKFVKPHINRYRIGIVEGRLGQAVGLEEIIIEQYRQARRFSVVCNSTENKCVKIGKEYLKTLLQELPHYHQKLSDQISNANQAKTDLFQRIKQTKSTLKQYLGKSIEKLEKAEQRYMESEMRSLQNDKEGNAGQFKLPTLHLKSAISQDYGSRERPRAFSSALAGSIRSEEHQMKSLKSQSNLDVYSAQDDNEHGESFALTGLRVQSNKKPSKSPINNQLVSSSYLTAEIREQRAERNLDGSINLPLLPLISKKSVTDIDGSSITLKKVIRAREKGKSAQYGGMIDCSKLIEEKQEILERKNNRIMREEIFPVGHIDYRQTKKDSVDDPMKLKASPAHSNRFMQMMLLKVLKRAGYDETARREGSIKQPARKDLTGSQLLRPKDAVIHTTLNLKLAAEANRSLSKHRQHEGGKNKRVQKQLLLVNSPFDDCYFSKM